MSWEAANVSKAAADDDAANPHDGSIVVHPSGRPQQQSRRSGETVEAALSRLSKAYTTSMECIGAMHKTDDMILRRRDENQPVGNNNTNSDDVDPLAVVNRVANAARKTLESSILLDPLIIRHAPTLHQCMADLYEEEQRASLASSTRWNAVQQQRPVPPTISSAAHKSTLIQLTYLSLVNYSDLLQGCCPCYATSRYCNKSTILDRGVVPKLKSLLQKESQAAAEDDTTMQVDGDAIPPCQYCSWRPEIPEETQRLAVAALCDASNLCYASDPILWLKLACASRSLERIVAVRDNTTMVQSHHRQLQRNALERGTVALASHMPPNRTVLRALRELLEEPEPQEYISKPISKEVITTTLDLPRYSWTLLGRMLLRACKGEDGPSLNTSTQPYSTASSVMFGSPRIDIRLSPMLVLPQRTLGRICQYLDNPSIWKLEATCRALSVSLVSARASMQDAEDRSQRATEKRANESSMGEKEQEAISGTSGTVSTSGVGEQQNDFEGRVGASANLPTVPARQSSRSSKRIISQQISSEKKQDREQNRKSFDYCFLASTLSCTKEEHEKLVNQLKGNKELAHLYEGADHVLTGLEGKKRGFRSESSSELVKSNRIEATERLSNASLPAFVDRWSSNNSGPMDMLERFLHHVSVNVEDVFSGESGSSGTMGLTSCIILCFEQLLLRTGCRHGFAPQFYKSTCTTNSIEESTMLFAMDLLYAELILRECDRNVPSVVEFDDDENMISLMLPALVQAHNELDLQFSEDTNTSHHVKNLFHVLQVRCMWLGACFYLWRSKIASEIYESRQAEEEGTLFLDAAISAFTNPALKHLKSVQTPQLVSPGRIDQHWRELSPLLLKRFRDEIQASSVISAAKQQFQDLVAQLDSVEDTEEENQKLTDDNIEVLEAIGLKLRGRYTTSHGNSDSKLSELVDNFLSLHGGHLMAPESIDITDGAQVLLSLQPLDVGSLRRISNPSTLSMLFFCLTVRQNKDHQEYLFNLIMHLILSTIDIHDSLTKEISRAISLKSNGSSGYDSDDDSSDSDDHSTDSNNRCGIGGPKKGNETKAVLCGKLVSYLLATLTTAIESLPMGERNTISSEKFAQVLDCVLSFSNRWYQSTARVLSIPDDATDRHIFHCVINLVDTLKQVGQMSKGVEASLLKGMVRIVISHGTLLKQTLSRRHRDRSDGSNRSSRQRACLLRVQLICAVSSRLGLLLSNNLAAVKDFRLVKSDLFSDTDPRMLSRNEEILFMDSVRWLRNLSSKNYEETPNKAETICPSFERPIVRRLRIPICAMVVGLCGSASTSRGALDLGEDPMGLSEFFDSDCSATDWKSDDEEAETDNIEHQQKELLRVICHAVHCIAATLDKVSDKDSIKHFLQTDCDETLGPLLPLVCARVLNFYADELLLNFGNPESTTSRKQQLWAEEYPYRTQDEGEYLDSVLHKVYRWLYGFVLVGEWDHVQNSGGKDLAHTLSSIYEISKGGFRPESTKATAQLYRCIVRAYATGRRTAPKAALELVSSALPPMHESERSKALRSFIFSPRMDAFSLEKLVQLVEKGDEWGSSFSEVHEALLISDESNYEASFQSDEVEAMLVRRGISSRLAGGPLPMISTDMGQKSDSSLDDRGLASESEEEIKKKFDAILDDICLSEPDCEGWYRAAQCLNMKADVVADRLGLTLGFGRVSNFSVPAQRRQHIQSMDIKQLLEEQNREEESSIRNHLNFFGCELSVFVEFAWSSYSSLKECSAKVGEKLIQADAVSQQEKAISSVVLKQIESNHEKGDFLGWQEAWGGIYVFALRHLALRFMSVALFVLRTKENKKDLDEVMVSEICEAIGVSLYSDLMASQRYGWPMDQMTSVRKRDLANAAKVCFQTACTIVENSSDKDDDSQGKATWDLLFMIGKCQEKIAWTYKRASYQKVSNNVPPARLYETHMEAALRQYADALQQAKKIEVDGGQLADQAGGSAHGSVEVLYRLHASRLKCLIHSVSRSADEIELSELEALRLTEKFTFSDKIQTTASDNTRDRVWTVFADVVQGLAECRQKQPFFHRSVYRHAQALMWSPVLNDPLSSVGSMNTVPAHKSFSIRGLNNSTPAAVSAGVIMSKLFDKKRAQLCAVWVTSNSASSPFQVLNTSIRKYDSLRGKYITAYLEAMHLCRQRSDIETFEKWVYACKRDLPSYFQASALNGGNRPAKSHSSDTLLLTADNAQSLSGRGLLTSAKRDSNKHLAHIFLQEMNEKLGKGEGKPSADGKKVAESYLKHAYACYLRLNCTREDLQKTRAFKYGGESVCEFEALCQAYLHYGDPKEVATATEFGDWSGGSGRKSAIFDAALEKCKELFPSVSGSFFSKKGAATKSKKDGGKKRKEASVDLASPTSPNAQGTKKISFEVNVPKGLTTGDTFLTQVKVGDGDPIKVKLTVPKGNPATLRFNLDVPKSSTRKITKKAKMSL